MSTHTAENVDATPRIASWVDRAQLAGLASVGAGAIHLSAAGIHAEHAALARIFVLMGAVQIVGGLVLALAGSRAAAAVVALVNVAALGGWALTRTTGISWVQGLEESERPQFADTACAALGAIGLVLAVLVLWRGGRAAPRVGLVAPGALVGIVSVAAMMTAATHVHSHGSEDAHVHEEASADAAAATPGAAAATPEHAHDAAAPGAAATTPDHAHDAGAGADGAASAAAPAAVTWPRPWDPAQPIDFAGVSGVTTEQEDRAEALVAATLQDLPQFADVTAIPALGFQSIGDSRSGFEHFISFANIRDDAFLDPNKPESLVYQVDGDQRTLVSAMYIAKDMTISDPQLVGYGGPLMQWHVHEDLCWSLDENKKPIVVGVKDEAGNCPAGSINAGGTNPMVHVWITPNECGPFAALEGHGAGQVAGDSPRTDQCVDDHHHAGGG